MMQPFWIDDTHPTFNQYVEMFALLALATTTVGRWAGLDLFVHYLISGSRSRRKARPMYLRPEEKTVGQANFENAIGVTRRDFLKTGIAAGAVSGAGLGAMYFGYDASVSNPLPVGFIGTGDEGNVLLGAVTPSYVQVVAIADIRPYNIHRAFHGDHSSENALRSAAG